MKAEAYLFAGMAAFFLVTDAVYIWLAREPAGGAALTVSFGMSAVISFFCAVNYRRKGGRPEDRPHGEIHERSGLIDFFPPQSPYPALTALGAAFMGLGVVYGLWLFLVGCGLAGGGIFGMVFQFTDVET
ncbi:cytochrome c oxidase subunit 4 [Streptomyces caatingaensis]|uniref:cytochrome-c oxidase n=1 Tax=Streptomyces caatingaensis TaxID=1678637 RepID=A0A0K9XMY8_9ACTN|nr:cytochrome c oxidase subunit 4 [Streptomyces caatingaensis]KNB54062.1 membrane protein [Streptomyces caatingaensis]